MLCRRRLLTLLPRNHAPLSSIAGQRLLKTIQLCPRQDASFSMSAKRNGQRQHFYLSADEEESVSAFLRKDDEAVILGKFKDSKSSHAEKAPPKRCKSRGKAASQSAATTQFTDIYLPEEPGDPQSRFPERLDHDLVYHVPAAKPKFESFVISAEDDPPLRGLDPEELAPETSQDPKTYKDFFIPLQHATTLPPPDIFPLPTPEEAMASGKHWWVPPPQPPYKNNSKHFEYSNQRIPGNKKVLCSYTTSLDQAERLVAQLEGRVFGVDLEWKPDTKNRVDVVQVCDEQQVLILHVCHMEHFPPTLKIVLEDPQKIKVGVAIKSDCTRLRNCYEVNCASIVELGTFAQEVDHERWAAIGITRRIIGLERLVHMYLDKPLLKGLGGRTNWTKRNLSPAAKQYAANDCYSSWKVFQMLEAIRQQLDGVEVPIELESEYIGTKLERRAAQLRDTTNTGVEIKQES